MRWWGNLRGDFQRYGDGDQYDGAIPALTGGVDWTRGNLVFGAFAGYGRGRIDFGQRRRQVQAVRCHPRRLRRLVRRRRRMGQRPAQLHAARLRRGSRRRSSARRPAATPVRRTAATSPPAINAGWNFGEGALQPRSGAERGLAADRRRWLRAKAIRPCRRRWPIRDQSFDSLIGSVGWQASYAINDHLAPYATLTYDHEFEECRQAGVRQRAVAAGFAGIRGAGPGTTTATTAPSLVGARTRMFGLDANIGASATVRAGRRQQCQRVRHAWAAASEPSLAQRHPKGPRGPFFSRCNPVAPIATTRAAGIDWPPRGCSSMVEL